MIRSSIFIIILLLTIQFGGSYALKYGLEYLFSKETGCTARLQQPVINFPLLRASAKNITLRCEDEDQNNFVYIGELTTSLNPGPLLRKKVVLTELLLSEAEAFSFEENSGLNRLLYFILSDPLPEDTSKWHSFITTGWDVSVGRVEILSKQSSDHSLQLIYPGVLIQSKNVRFDVLPGPKEIPSPTNIIASGLSIKLLEEEKVFDFDSAILRGDFIDGGLEITSSKFVKKGEENNLMLSLDGVIYYKEGVAIEGSVEASGDWSLVGPLRDTLEVIGINQLGVKIAGNYTFLDDQHRGEIVFKITSQTPMMIKQELSCQFPQLEGAISFQDGKFVMDQVVAPYLFNDLQLSFAEDELTGSAKLAIPSKAQLSQYCSTFTGLEMAKEKSASQIFLYEVLSGSEVDLEVAGKISPVDLDLKVDARLRQDELSEASRLRADIKLNPQSVAVKFREDAQRSSFKRRERVSAGGVYETAFDLEQPGIISGDVLYLTDQNRFELSKIEIKNIIVGSLWNRAVPFLGEDAGVENLPQQLTGATISLSGKLTVAEQQIQDGRLEVDLTEIELTDDLYASLDASAVMDQSKITLESGLLKLAEGEFALSGFLTWNGKGSFLAQGETGRLVELAEWNTVFSGLEGSAVVTLAADLELPQYDINLSAQVDTFDLWSGQQNPLSQVELNVANDSITAEAKLFGEELILKVTPDRERQELLTASLSLKSFPIRYFLVPDEESRAIIDNKITLKTDYAFTIDEPLKGKGTLLLEQLTRTNSEELIDNALPMNEKPTLLISDGSATLRNFNFRDLKRELSITGNLGLDSGWNISTKGDWEFATVVPIRHLDQLTGNVTFNASIRGDLFAPRLFGELKLQEGRFSLLLEDDVIGAENVVIDVGLQSDNVEIRTITANIGSGQLMGSGSIINPFDKYNRRSEVSIDFVDLYLEPVDDFSANVNGKISFSEQALTGCNVAGEINLVEGLYQSSIDLRTLLQKTSSALIGGGRSQRKVQRADEQEEALCGLDVVLKADSGIIVETPLVVAESKGQLRLSAIQGGVTTVDGSIDAIGGTLGMRSKQFDIIHGSILFRPQDTEIDPRLDILAETSVRTAEGEDSWVQMSIRGRASDPRISFSSDYGLSETEIVSLLGFGASIRNVSLFGSNGATDRSVGSLLNPTSDVSFTDRVAGLTGFSEVQIDSVVSPRTGDTVPRFSVERRIVGQLSAELATELGIIQESFAKFAFPLSPYLDFVGGWKSSPITRGLESSSGSLNSGFEYKTFFPGTSFFPEELSW